MSEPTSPLQIPDYRRFWVARFLLVCATLSMVVLIGYQTYDIARADYGMSRPQAAFQLGLLGLAQFVPFFLLTPVAGVAADRFDRRYVACISLSIDFCIAVAIAWFTWTGSLTLPLCFLLAASHGAARVFSGPSMSAITPNVVPTPLLPRAIALSSIGFTGGQVFGPAVGGLLFAANPTLPYALSAVLMAICAVLVLSIRPIRSSHRSDLHPVRQMIEGFTFVWRSRFLLGCVSLDLFAVLFAGATALLPVYARDILHVGPEGLGIMRAAPAVGAGSVALYLSFRPFAHNVGVKMLWAVAVFGAATLAFGLSRNLFLSLGLLAVLGGADMVSVFVRGTLEQLSTPDTMRGRVSSISGLAVSASNELGEMQSGLAAALLGATGAVVFGGAGAIIITLLWTFIFPELPRAKTFEPQYRQPDPTGGEPD
ncbi:MAG: MFS transporter [Candidatus Andeanibacterium colombiense]|uniref:MFS transporter n=1 Tax=Candidatus Andeanibacterium colombiense TaxID=3121345 RepID=A0AAJ5X7C6_9SPHN|nr:MAG: MFS transporter [Sphingomonadaceae bacterium]